MSRLKRKGVSLQKQTQWFFPLGPSLNFLPRIVRMNSSAAALDGRSGLLLFMSGLWDKSILTCNYNVYISDVVICLIHYWLKVTKV